MPKIKSNKELEEEKEQEVKSDVAEFLDDNQGSEEDEPTSGEDQPKPDNNEEEQEKPSGEEEEEKPDEGSDEKEEKDETPEETIARLRDTVEDLSGDTKVESKPETTEDEPEKEKEDQPEKVDFDNLNFVSAEDFEKIQSDPKALNDLLIKVAQTASSQAREQVMQDIPELVRTTASRQTTLMNKVKDFYQANSDLKEYKKYVSSKANQIQSENPDLSIDEIFDRTAKEVRKDLALSQKAKEKEEERKNGQDQPAFAGGSKGGGRSQGVDTRSDQQKQIDNILN